MALVVEAALSNYFPQSKRTGELASRLLHLSVSPNRTIWFQTPTGEPWQQIFSKGWIAPKINYLGENRGLHHWIAGLWNLKCMSYVVSLEDSMKTLSEQQRIVLDNLRRAINDAISESEAVGQAIAALVEAGVKTPVSIDVSLLDDPVGVAVPAKARRGADQSAGFTKFDKSFLHALGIADEQAG